MKPFRHFGEIFSKTTIEMSGLIWKNWERFLPSLLIYLLIFSASSGNGYVLRITKQMKSKMIALSKKKKELKEIPSVVIRLTSGKNHFSKFRP